jgi:hypothetical protein
MQVGADPDWMSFTGNAEMDLSLEFFRRSAAYLCAA